MQNKFLLAGAARVRIKLLRIFPGTERAESHGLGFTPLEKGGPMGSWQYSDLAVNGAHVLKSPAIQALQSINKLGTVKLGSFDLSAELLQDISGGKALFAIDQQQYLQGYLPIVFLTLYKLYLLAPGGGQPVLTGPSLVTRDTASRVISLSKQGIR